MVLTADLVFSTVKSMLLFLPSSQIKPLIFTTGLQYHNTLPVKAAHRLAGIV
jgi:hypothetical protein